MLSIASRSRRCTLAALCVFTSSTPPCTTTVSSTVPTGRTTLIVAVKSPGRLMPSRRTVWNPGSVKVTV
jgi:hypothetical protein